MAGLPDPDVSSSGERHLPWAGHVHRTLAVSPIGFGFRVEHGDFVVDEIPAYGPSGEGEHLFVRIEKEGLPTDRAARVLAQALGVAPRDIGAAGRKDARGITRQWLSLPGVAPEAALAVEHDRVRVLEAARHGHKLRRGHLKGNRFRLRLRGLDPARDVDVARVLAVLEREGLPNAFGPQRFGAQGDNADLGALLLREGRAAHAAALGAKRPSRIASALRTLHVNALQSRIFNRVVAARLAGGPEVATVVPGDLAQKTDTGGVFLVQDPADAERAARFEISPTGPMPGYRTDLASGEPGELEREALAAEGLDVEAFGPGGHLSQRGTRRPLRVRVDELQHHREGADVLLSFRLPPGSYATALVEELAKTAPRSETGGGSTEFGGPSEPPACR